MNICVYAIAKNEEQFVDRFVDAAREADCICVLDTGSTDRTVELLADRGVIVRQEIVDPWRFDTARNKSMELIPEDTDVCVCLDLDEVPLPGWRAALEAAWVPGTEQARYQMVGSRNGDGTPGTSWWIGKIHAPGAVVWKYPVHEVPVRADGAAGNVADVPGMVVEHRPDPNKSRGSYLPLLELAARENPEDARCAHYLGREYMYYQRWDDAIRELTRHLSLPSATWTEERCASMRYLAACCRGMGCHLEAQRWAMKAVGEQPYLRESWYAAEQAAYYAEDWARVVYFGEKAEAITRRSGVCINEQEAWGSAVCDLLSIGYWHVGQTGLAAAAAERALAIDPGNERIRWNLEFYRTRLNGREAEA